MNLIHLLVPLFLVAVLSPAKAATYSVGVAGCSHFSLHDALAAASANPAGPHLIKLLDGELNTGGLDLDDPAADITIEGGYAACADSAPTAGGRMVIRQINPARVLRFANANDGRRRLELRHVTLTGGDEGISDVLGGGGALVIRNATLVLGAGARVEGNRAGNGGGVGLFGTPSQRAELILTGGAVIDDNEAAGAGNLGNGGGVFALDNADIRLLHGTISRNHARRAGGGVALNTARTQLLALPITDVEPLASVVLFFNTSGGSTFSTNSGLGGAIYTKEGAVTISAPAIDRFTTFITDNVGHLGGAIYAEGAAGTGQPFTFISMRNTFLQDNQAEGKGGAFYSENAVDWVLDHNGPGRPCVFAGETLPCSVVRNNAAFNSGSTGSPGGGVGYIGNEAGSQRGIFRFSRTLFADNHDYNGGKAAVAVANGTSEMIFERCIFVGNEADTGNDGAMLRNAPGIGLRFVYNTVLANTVDTLFYMNGGLLRAQGSILWSPGSEVWTPVAGATMETNACAIAHAAAPGALVLDPRLDDAFVPRGNSPAIDYCDDDTVTAGLDAHRAAPGYDANGIAAAWGNNDLGAIENRDILLYDGFGNRWNQ